VIVLKHAANLRKYFKYASFFWEIFLKQ